MPIPDNILKQLKCCLNNDGHIVIEPLLIPCGGNACKSCVKDLKETNACYSCNGRHSINDLANATTNKIVVALLEDYTIELFDHILPKVTTVTNDLKSKIEFF